MKSIFISIPISGKEDSYDKRLEEAVKYIKEKYPEYEIITPKDAAKNLEQAYFPLQPKYKDYLLTDMQEIYDCDAIFMCNGWELTQSFPTCSTKSYYLFALSTFTDTKPAVYGYHY